MKYIRKFESAAAMQAAIQAGTIERPFVAWDGDANAETINVEYGNTTPPPPPVYDYFIATLNIEYEGEPLKFIYENCGQLAYTPSKVIINGIEQEEIKQYYYADDGVIIGENIVEIWIDPEDSRYYTMDEVFRGCTQLTSVIIPNYITSIGSNAFNGCNALTSITIPNTVTSIGTNAFSSTGIISIVIPNTITSIGANAFNSSSITSIIIPNTITLIDCGVFGFCSGLVSVTIPNSITCINEEAFKYCSSLTSITIPNSVNSIGSLAFYCCQQLTSITVEAIIPPVIYSDTFSDTNNCPIYVPASSVDTYKAATGWSNYADRIQPIQ